MTSSRETRFACPNRRACSQASLFPSFLPHPLPALLLAPFFVRSLTLVPRSLLLNRNACYAGYTYWKARIQSSPSPWPRPSSSKARHPCNLVTTHVPFAMAGNVLWISFWKSVEKSKSKCLANRTSNKLREDYLGLGLSLDRVLEAFRLVRQLLQELPVRLLRLVDSLFRQRHSNQVISDYFNLTYAFSQFKLPLV